VSSFPHGVCFVDPTVDGNQLQQIYQKVTAKFPELVSKKHEQFTPHMTIANKIKKH
jgi:2'-5' RNA ligase